MTSDYPLTTLRASRNLHLRQRNSACFSVGWQIFITSPANRAEGKRRLALATP